MSLLEAIIAYNIKEAAYLNRLGFDDHSGFIQTEDLNIWAGREVLTAKSFNEWINFQHDYSDHYKDVHGFRPRGSFYPDTLTGFREGTESLILSSDIDRYNDEQWEAEKVKIANKRAHKERCIKRASKNLGSSSLSDAFNAAMN